MTNGLGEQWGNLTSLGERLGKTELNYYPLPTTYRGDALLLAVDSDRCRHLLVPVPNETRVIGDQRSRGVRISERDLEENGATRKFIDVVCLVPELNDLFDDVLTDMIDEVSGDPGNPGGVCRNVLNRWRELLERGRAPKLGREALVGLFGELVVLKDLVGLSPVALGTWTGPSGARHDFWLNSSALEVKASTRRNGRSCTINGHLQLVPPHGGTLNLVYFKVEQLPNGRSVPELIAEIYAAGVDRLDFRGRLQDAGYDDSYSEEYGEIRLSILERRMYVVDADFPRIVPESFSDGALPTGITELTYAVDLLNEPPEPLDEDAEIAFLKRLAGVSA